ncbi:Mannose-1-phosphate guanylyltransferase (GDP) [Halomonas sp. TD01]|nr:Mannose-1-phosphate guanylyltransferase (GDP) [Halomonas sp. TD01]
MLKNPAKAGFFRFYLIATLFTPHASRLTPHASRLTPHAHILF